jgi:anti-sigma factor RsiW
MPTTHDIHNDIEPWLAAAVHGQLTAEENAAFHEHLATCRDCRSLYEQEQAMNTMIENTLGVARPDLAFEQRIVSGFRRRAPARGGFFAPLGNLMRMRATQITAVAALLLALVQMGRLVTGELGGSELKSAASDAASRRCSARTAWKTQQAASGAHTHAMQRRSAAGRRRHNSNHSLTRCKANQHQPVRRRRRLQ